MDTPAIELLDATKRFGPTTALDAASFSVEAGELAFLVGPSGSGKTTVLRLIGRELIADDGSVRVLGVDVGRLGVRRIANFRQQVAVIPQNYPLLHNRDVMGNLHFALSVLGFGRRDALARSGDVLERVGLADKAHARPDELSGGERQRVAIARAVVGQPRILLADEPTGNLDPAATAGIMRLLDGIAKDGTTVLVSTHDRAVVDSLRRHVIELKDGRVERDEVRGGYKAVAR